MPSAPTHSSDSLRKVAAATALGGGSLIGIGGLAFGLGYTQAKIARRRVGIRKKSAPYADGRYGHQLKGTSLRYVMLGDSAAAGFNAGDPLRTPGAIIAQGLSEAANRPVRYLNMAMVGARSRDIASQVERALQVKPHVVTIIIGGNDVTHLVPAHVAVAHLSAQVKRLEESGCRVVVGTCPDVGAVRPIPQPLRWVGQKLSRQMAAAQTVGVVASGGRTVSLADLIGEVFRERPELMFSDDNFHPSDDGYAAIAMALLPSVLDSIGLGRTERLGDQVMTVSDAAASAVDVTGAEVSRTTLGGVPDLHRAGPHGRWVTIRRRLRGPLPTMIEPGPLEGQDLRDPQDLQEHAPAEGANSE